jgi:hypothetical protein
LGDGVLVRCGEGHQHRHQQQPQRQGYSVHRSRLIINFAAKVQQKNDMCK